MGHKDLPNIKIKQDQCKCAECFAIFREGEGITSLNFNKVRFRCALDMHLIGDLEAAKVQSCPKGKPPLA